MQAIPGAAFQCGSCPLGNRLAGDQCEICSNNTYMDERQRAAAPAVCGECDAGSMVSCRGVDAADPLNFCPAPGQAGGDKCACARGFSFVHQPGAMLGFGCEACPAGVRASATSS